MSDHIEQLIEAMAYEDEVCDALLAELRGTGDELQVRAMFGTMMRDACSARDPLAVIEVDDVLEEVLASPFGMLSLTEFTGLAVLLGSLVYPGLAPDDAGNRAMSDAIRDNFDFPVVKALIASADSNWEHFLSDFEHWEQIVWTLESELERVDERTMRLTIPAAARYTLPGFWRGMLPLFGMVGQVEAVVEGEYCRVTVTWSG